jgi:sensor domain CHASE-containing protein
MGGLALMAVMVATFALAFYLIVRNEATEQETNAMLREDIWS